MQHFEQEFETSPSMYGEIAVENGVENEFETSMILAKTVAKDKLIEHLIESMTFKIMKEKSEPKKKSEKSKKSFEKTKSVKTFETLFGIKALESANTFLADISPYADDKFFLTSWQPLPTTFTVDAEGWNLTVSTMDLLSYVGDISKKLKSHCENGWFSIYVTKNRDGQTCCNISVKRARK